MHRRETLSRHARPSAVRGARATLAAMAFAIVIGVPLGFIAALKPGGFVDTISMVTAVSGLSVPKFWLGLLLMYLFALKLGWLPSFGEWWRKKGWRPWWKSVTMRTTQSQL